MNKAKLSAFKFVKHRIESLDFQLITDVPEDAYSEMFVEFESSTSLLDTSSVEAQIPEDISFSIVSMQVKVSWDKSRGPFELNVNISGLFTHHPEMNHEAFTNFSEVLAPSILFSHLRPFVRLLTSEAGFDYQLPLINVTDTIKANRNAATSVHDSNPSDE